MAATLTDSEATVRLLDELLGGSPLQRVGFRLWDGTVWPDERPREATLVLKHPGALRQMFGGGTEKALAEAYLRDDFDVVGDMEAAFELADTLGQRDATWFRNVRTYFQLRRLPGARADASIRHFAERDDALHTVPRDREAVSFHYDVSNDFYQLWLDRRMVYSCAYFERPELSLDDAQEAKLRHICRKLRLRPGQQLLDIGCGWGGLAIYAARNFGVNVTGVTLSAAQAELAAHRAQEAGVGHLVDIHRRDYRELDPRAKTFDAVVSVGMSEHVGRNKLPEYFRHASSLLRAGGVFLNHAIGEGVRTRPRNGPSFIDAYVFPDSDIPPIPLVLQSAEAAGLEVRDVENLREHYARTLRHWVSRLEAAHEPALRFVSESTFRIWRLYMAGSAHGFEGGQLAIYQVLLAKLEPSGRVRLPPTRADWYPAG